MKYLLDTGVLSELFRKVPDKNVVQWLNRIEESQLFLSVLTLGEIEKGISKSTDPLRQEKLRNWLEYDLKERFSHRTIPVDLKVALKWGETQAMSEKAGAPHARD